jgi:hypothetical protein
MKPEIRDIINQHRKKSKRQLLVEATAREYELKWEAEHKAKMKAEEDAIPHESKKEFIRLFKAGGITLGDAARKCGILDIGIAARILAKQIKSTYTHIEELE